MPAYSTCYTTSCRLLLLLLLLLPCCCAHSIGRHPGVYGGLRAAGKKADLSLVVADAPAAAAGTFTLNVMCAAPVLYCKDVLAKQQTVRAVLTNAGQANAATGDQGYADALECAKATAAALGIKPEEVLLMSTGDDDMVQGQQQQQQQQQLEKQWDRLQQQQQQQLLRAMHAEQEHRLATAAATVPRCPSPADKSLLPPCVCVTRHPLCLLPLSSLPYTHPYTPFWLLPQASLGVA
jgi:hypothetical protein